MEHDKQVRKRMKVTSASAHYSRLFSMKIADIIFSFHQSLNALKPEVHYWLSCDLKKSCEFATNRVEQSKPVNFSKIRLKPQNQMCQLKSKCPKFFE